MERTHSVLRSRTETDASEGHAEGLSGHGRQGGGPARRGDREQKPPGSDVSAATLGAGR